jgi:ribosomal protein S18 acetylase RimI-like enzyme
MDQIKNPRIKLASQLNYREYEDIKSLREYCVKNDNITLKLELDYKLIDKSENLNKINEFMFYDDGTLIGYIGICQFGGETLEVNGMVHPEYRRMGVFSRLFSLVKEEWDKRSSRDMYLLSDHKSLPGLEFIKRTGAYYDNSEYEMFLKGDPINSTDLNELRLRKATNKDVNEIARQNAIYFDVDPEKVDLLLPEEEANRGVDIYIAEFENAVIGKVHLEVSDGRGGIYGLGVLPQYQNRGYGREILIKSVELLKAKQINEIMLQVAVKNKNALRLYKSCGFEVTSTMDYYRLSKDVK